MRLERKTNGLGDRVSTASGVLLENTTGKHGQLSVVSDQRLAAHLGLSASEGALGADLNRLT